MRPIDADRLLEVLRYNRDQCGEEKQAIAVDIDAIIKLINGLPTLALQEILKEDKENVDTANQKEMVRYDCLW